MTTDPRLLETLRRLATKGIPDTMPISLCPEGAALERIEQLDAENERLREALREIGDTPATMANDSESLRHTIKTIRHMVRVAITAGDRK